MRVGKAGQTCDEVCEAHEEVCDIQHIHLMNSCDFVKNTFKNKCNNACTFVGVHIRETERERRGESNEKARRGNDILVPIITI